MNWITAVCGFISIYSLAGLIYSLIRSASGDSLAFFGVGFVLFVALGGANEARLRRRRRN